jgi:pyruvate kinase
LRLLLGWARVRRAVGAVEERADMLGLSHEIPEAAQNPTIGGAMSNAACDVAESLRAAAILVPTFSGATASAVARLRPRRPIVALTHVDWAQRQMARSSGA